jgi:plastocyanin
MSSVRLCLAALVAAGACAVLAGPAAAASGPSVKMYDDCDPASFDAAIGAGTCVGDGRSTFLEFVTTVAATKSHPEWRFQPESREIRGGQSLDVRNRGGERHTFTEVTKFQDIGCIPPVNALLLGLDPNDPNVRIPLSRVCDDAALLEATQFVPEERRAVIPDGPGTHLYQCMIHPWMRTTVRVKDD